MSEVIASRTWSQGSKEDKWRIKVQAELVALGAQDPHFSITGSFRSKDLDLDGCIHEKILEHFPELQILVDLHLADRDGVPLYAWENGAYWAGFSKYLARDVSQVGRHFRIEDSEALSLLCQVDNLVENGYKPPSALKEACDIFDLPARWKAEAQEGLEVLQSTKEVRDGK